MPKAGHSSRTRNGRNGQTFKKKKRKGLGKDSSTVRYGEGGFKKRRQENNGSGEKMARRGKMLKRRSIIPIEGV